MGNYNTENDQPINIIDDTSKDHSYFTVIPRLVWALCDDPYEFTLWCVIKSVAGDKGTCMLSTPDLATLTMMSAGKVSETRKRLLEIGLLDGEFYRDPGYPQPVWHLKIPDLWQRNLEWSQENLSLKGRVEFKREQLKKSIHQVKPSPHERGVTPGETKKILKKNLKKSTSKEKNDEKMRGSSLASLPVSSKHHPNVELFKQVTGRYPSKNLAAEVGALGEIDENRFRACYTLWEKLGYNPMNIDGWLFDWYEHGIPADYASSSEYKIAGRPSPANIASEVYGGSDSTIFLDGLDGYENITAKRMAEER